MSHSNISIFIPHLGCPFRCIFCNQFKITGSDSVVTPSDVYNLLSELINNRKLTDGDTQIAFFGGSFTAISRKLMIEYLEAANHFVGRGMFSGIRISTRPDCIDEDTLEILAKYNVKTIELGIQSFDDDVLTKSQRGHSADVAERSCRLILSSGFELGLQMMCGLPGDNEEKDMETARKIIDLGCRQVRIYPVVVLKDTELYTKYQNGEYNPLTVDEAVNTCAKLYSLFTSNNVTILKIGLHSDSGCVAGPFHPAFGELVRSQVFFNELSPALSKQQENIVQVRPSFMSIAVGNAKRNLNKFAVQGYDVKFLPEPTLSENWKLK